MIFELSFFLVQPELNPSVKKKAEHVHQYRQAQKNRRRKMAQDKAGAITLSSNLGLISRHLHIEGMQHCLLNEGVGCSTSCVCLCLQWD
jgi:hypothetical protein